MIQDLSRVGEKAVEDIKGKIQFLLSFIFPRYFRTLTSCQIFLDSLPSILLLTSQVDIVVHSFSFIGLFDCYIVWITILISSVDILFVLLCGLLHSFLQWIFCLSFGNDNMVLGLC